MSWFFGGGSSNNNSSSGGSTEHDSYDSPSPYQEHAYDNHAEFTQPNSFGSNVYSSPSSSSSSSSAQQQQLREQLLAEQQKLMIQQVLFNLADSAFDSCVQKPSSSLSSSEKQCLAAVASKYLQTNEFVRHKIENAPK